MVIDLVVLFVYKFQGKLWDCEKWVTNITDSLSWNAKLSFLKAINMWKFVTCNIFVSLVLNEQAMILHNQLLSPQCCR